MPQADELMSRREYSPQPSKKDGISLMEAWLNAMCLAKCPAQLGSQ